MFRLSRCIDILQNKFAKRHIDVAHMKLEDPIIQHKSAQQIVMLFEGIHQITAKKIIKLIKEQKLKVQVAIQGEKVRVTGKKRDDLQSVISCSHFNFGFVTPSVHGGVPAKRLRKAPSVFFLAPSLLGLLLTPP
nr:DUF520 family protein [Coxiella endosymbiont of Ornithodoros amblus]